MFVSFDDLMSRLKATGYFIDPVMTRIVFLAAKLQKPLLLEGPAGSGKTQLAISVAQAAGNRAVLLTVTLVETDQIRVNIVPKKLKDGDNDALTTPLSATGTAEELDAELSKT